MSPTNKLNKVMVPIVGLLTAVLLFLFTNIFCLEWCWENDMDRRINVLSHAGVLVIPLLIVLALLKRGIFIAWLKRIAWWYPFFLFLVIENATDSFFFPERWMINACVVFLYIISIVFVAYRLLKFRKNSGATER